MKYVTMPCEIEAVRWTGNNKDEIIKFTDGKARYERSNIYIDTLEGTMLADVHDFIIKGLRGEYYPCKPDVFEKKYKPI